MLINQSNSKITSLPQAIRVIAWQILLIKLIYFNWLSNPNPNIACCF